MSNNNPTNTPTQSKTAYWLLGGCGLFSIILAISIIVIAFLVFGSMNNLTTKITNLESSISDNTSKIDKIETDVSKQNSKDTSSSTETKKATETTPKVTPAQTVVKFLNSSLGTLPNSNISETTAKNQLTTKLKNEYSDPLFIPTSLCIQDGPTEIKTSSENIDNDAAVVTIDVKYADEWTSFWKFNLTIIDNTWKISKITCLNN